MVAGFAIIVLLLPLNVGLGVSGLGRFWSAVVWIASGGASWAIVKWIYHLQTKRKAGRDS
jgi:hypothetical protein